MKPLVALRGSLFLTIATLLTGCGTASKLVGNDDRGHYLYNRQGVDLLVEDASRKTTVLKDRNSSERFCRSPNPDFASGQSNAVSLGLANGPSIGTSTGAQIDSLGGRSPALLITRELMYRACELALNLDANTELTKEIYWKFLGTVELAIKNQTGVGVPGSTVSTSATVTLPAAIPQGNSSTGLPGLPNGGPMPGSTDPTQGMGGPVSGFPGMVPGSSGVDPKNLIPK